MKAEREAKLHTYCLPDIKGTKDSVVIKRLTPWSFI